MKKICILLCILCALDLPAQNAGRVDRPEKLKYPPLSYEPPNAADYRVVLKSGPVAYIVPDRELPLVNISILIRAGDYMDPQGKEGLASMTGYLMSRAGIASKSADELEERLAFLAAQLSTGIADVQGSAGVNLLSKDLDEGLSLLRDVLTAPRFQEDKIKLRKQQALQNMKQRNDDSAGIEARERNFLSYGEDFFLNRHSTAASVESITRDDLISFHKKWVHPANFVVAVSGDFDRADMIARLEKLFSKWPFQGDKAPPIPNNPHMAAPGLYLVNKEVNQGRAGIVMPGLLRDDPDYFAADVMNDILGGGGFTSRIVNRVRSDEGLAYSAGSGIPGGTYYPLTFRAAFQSKSRTVAFAMSLVVEEMKRIVAEPVSDEEINTVKNQMIETFPRTFASKASIASIFANDELTGRYVKQPDYWKTYRSKVQAVTKSDVQRVAKRFVQLDKAIILVVGKTEDVLAGHPDHPVKLQDLAGGKVTQLPLRYPLTMKPMPMPGQ